MTQLLSALGFPPLRHNRTRCLIHGGDSRTSVSVSPQKGLWHCHVCHEGGGKLKLVERVLDCDRQAALLYLADLAGIPVQEYSPAEKAEWRRRRAAAQAEGERFHSWLIHCIELLRNQRNTLLSSYHGAKRYALSHSPDDDLFRWELAAGVLERYDRIEEFDRQIDYLSDVANYPALLSLFRQSDRRAA